MEAILESEELSLAKLKDILSSRKKRLSLYKIKDKAGQTITFKPNAVQQVLLERLWYRDLILKSRQHGLTTLICILWLDAALFRAGTHAGVVAHKKADAEKFFNEKILFAYDNLPPLLRESIPLVKRDMSGHLEFANGSVVDVGVSLRSGTYQRILISEYGPMCSMFPQRAQEVRTGALNTIAPVDTEAGNDNIVVIESTAYGQYGDFAERANKAIELDTMIKAGQAELSTMDYRFFFFPWFQDPVNSLPENEAKRVTIPPSMADYLDKISVEVGVEFTLGQRAWYTKKAEEQGDLMKREHPSTPQEAFEGSMEGLIFAKEMTAARKEGRITKVPHQPNLPVDTWWDIGSLDATCIWFTQDVGRAIHVVDYYTNSGETIAHYWDVLQKRAKEKGYRYNTHNGPHDIGVFEFGGGHRMNTAAKLGLKFTQVPRVDEKINAINAARELIPICYFDKEACAEGILCLDSYRKKKNEQMSIPGKPVFSDTPVHDWASHGSDAFMTLAQGHKFGGTPKEKRMRAAQRPAAAGWT